MAELCERLAVLHFGNKIADSPTEAVLDDPKVIEVCLGGRSELLEVADGGPPTGRSSSTAASRSRSARVKLSRYRIERRRQDDAPEDHRGAEAPRRAGRFALGQRRDGNLCRRDRAARRGPRAGRATHLSRSHGSRNCGLADTLATTREVSKETLRRWKSSFPYLLRNGKRKVPL